MSAGTVNERFILAEDEALKKKLTGLTLFTERESDNAVDVGVWYRWPEKEFADNLFPFITIDLYDAVPDHERMHSYNWISYDYLPDAEPDAATPKNFFAPYPIPYTLMYVVQTYCRNARHERELTRRLLQWDLLPHRFGDLYVQTDNTTRRLDVLDGPTADTFIDTLNKRTFRRRFMIGVSAEMLPEEAYEALSVNNVVFETTLSQPDLLQQPSYPVH